MPEVRPVLAENIPQIAEFCSRFPEDGRSEQFWINRLNHWWRDNPAMTEDWPYGWMLMAENALQGLILCIPIRLLIDGKTQLGALRSTWRVLPAYRSSSLKLIVAMDASISHLVNFNGTPNSTAVEVMKMFASYWTCIRREVESSIHWGSPFATLRHALRTPSPRKQLPRFVPSRATTPETAADQVNRHWVKSQNLTQNGTVRDWNYWEWFSINNPSFDCSLFYHPVEISNCTVPLCALTADFGDGRLLLTDIWPHDAPENQLREMVDLIIKTARRHGFHSIQISHLIPPLSKAADRADRYKTISQEAGIWVHQPSNENNRLTGFWPLHNGDALL